MTKVQPNFTWQAFEGNDLDQKNQFEFTLGKQYNVLANGINATIDDISYFLTERATGEAWIDQKRIYTRTFQGLVTAFPMSVGATISTLIEAYGSVQDTIPLTTTSYPIPYVDPNTLANGIGIKLSGGNIQLVTNGATYNTYTASITIKDTKV